MTEQSALLITVPAAEPAVARHRSRLDTSAADGVPAHITVLYPFLPPDQIDADIHATLARLFAAVPGFRFTLDRTGSFRRGDPAPDHRRGRLASGPRGGRDGGPPAPPHRSGSHLGHAGHPM